MKSLEWHYTNQIQFLIIIVIPRATSKLPQTSPCVRPCKNYYTVHFEVQLWSTRDEYAFYGLLLRIRSLIHIHKNQWPPLNLGAIAQIKHVCKCSQFL